MTPAIFACSGPGAGRVIAENIQAGYVHAGILGLLLLISLALFALNRRRQIPIAISIMLLLHPAWTISAIGGDCGHMKYESSWVFTGAGMLMLAWQVIRNRIASRKQSSIVKQS